MRSIRTACAFILLLPFVVSAQTWTFTKVGSEYALDLPSSKWYAVSRADVHDHEDFVYRDNGTAAYLRLTKRVVKPGTTAIQIFKHDEKWELRHLPGYVVCGDCSGQPFQGTLSGSVFSYEYIRDGAVTVGQVYYLQLDQSSFYVLRFTVKRDNLQSMRGQMDSIARSFRILSSSQEPSSGPSRAPRL